MDQDNNDIFLMFLLYVAAFVVSIFITRAIFSIPRFLRYQRAQMKLLALIAYKQEVDPEKIKQIINIAEGVEEEKFAEVGAPSYTSVVRVAIKQQQEKAPTA